MNREKLVCIILVNYKGYTDTIECIKSLLEIDYHNYRIIVVDNGAYDRTRFQKTEIDSDIIEYMYLEENKGFADGNNKGIEYAFKYSPDYFLLLNNDTIVKKDFLTKMVSMCENQFGLIGGKIYYHLEPDILWYAGGSYNRVTGCSEHFGYRKKDCEEYSKNKEVNFITGCLMLIPSKIIEKVGYLDTNYFMYSEDVDYCCRVLDNGFKMYYCADAIIFHKIGMSMNDKNETRNYFIYKNQFVMIQKYGIKKRKAYRNIMIQMCKDMLKKRIKIRTIIKVLHDINASE